MKKKRDFISGSPLSLPQLINNKSSSRILEVTVLSCKNLPIVPTGALCYVRLKLGEASARTASVRGASEVIWGSHGDCVSIPTHEMFDLFGQPCVGGLEGLQVEVVQTEGGDEFVIACSEVSIYVVAANAASENEGGEWYLMRPPVSKLSRVLHDSTNAEHAPPVSPQYGSPLINLDFSWGPPSPSSGSSTALSATRKERDEVYFADSAETPVNSKYIFVSVDPPAGKVMRPATGEGTAMIPEHIMAMAFGESHGQETLGAMGTCFKQTGGWTVKSASPQVRPQATQAYRPVYRTRQQQQQPERLSARRHAYTPLVPLSSTDLYGELLFNGNHGSYYKEDHGDGGGRGAKASSTEHDLTYSVANSSASSSFVSSPPSSGADASFFSEGSAIGARESATPPPQPARENVTGSGHGPAELESEKSWLADLLGVVMPLVEGAGGEKAKKGCSKWAMDLEEDIGKCCVTCTGRTVMRAQVQGDAGVGVTISTVDTDNLVIMALSPGGPAERCGKIRVGDALVAVNGVKMASRMRDGSGAPGSIEGLLRGSAGSSVMLTLRRRVEATGGKSVLHDVRLWRVKTSSYSRYEQKSPGQGGERKGVPSLWTPGQTPRYDSDFYCY